MKRSDISDEHVLALVDAWHAGAGLGAGYALVEEGVPYKVALAKIEHMIVRRLLTCGVTPMIPFRDAPRD